MRNAAGAFMRARSTISSGSDLRASRRRQPRQRANLRQRRRHRYARLQSPDRFPGSSLAGPGSSITAAPSPNDLDPRVSPTRNFSLFVFTVAGDGRAVARDIFLDGNTFVFQPIRRQGSFFVADLSVGSGLNRRPLATYLHLRETHARIYDPATILLTISARLSLCRAPFRAV